MSTRAELLERLVIAHEKLAKATDFLARTFGEVVYSGESIGLDVNVGMGLRHYPIRISQVKTPKGGTR